MIRFPNSNGVKTQDNIYYDVRIDHDPNGLSYSPMEYDVTRTFPIVEFPQDYYLAITDFAIPLDSIPIFISSIIPNPIDPNDKNYTPYIVELVSPGGISYPIHLTFIPSNNGSPPSDPLIPSTYYYVYSYTQFLVMINNGLYDSWVAAGTPGTDFPHLIYNYDFKYISLVIHSDFYNLGWKIRINPDLYTFLQGFDYIFKTLNSTYRYEFNFFEMGNTCNVNGVNVGSTTENYLIFSQEYYTMSEWTQLRKIFITTDSIPVPPQYTSTLSNNGQGSQATKAQILYDYIPNFSIVQSPRLISYYNRGDQYRLIDLQTQDPIYRISISVFWMDQLGNLNKVYLRNGNTANLTLGFFKKSLYNYDWKK